MILEFAFLETHVQAVDGRKKTRTSLQRSAGSHLPHDFLSCKLVTFPNQIRCNILSWKGQTLNIGPPLEVKYNPMCNHHSYTTNLATTSFRVPRSYKIRWSFHFTSHKSLLITIPPLDIQGNVGLTGQAIMGHGRKFSKKNGARDEWIELNEKYDRNHQMSIVWTQGEYTTHPVWFFRIFSVQSSKNDSIEPLCIAR